MGGAAGNNAAKGTERFFKGVWPPLSVRTAAHRSKTPHDGFWQILVCEISCFGLNTFFASGRAAALRPFLKKLTPPAFSYLLSIWLMLNRVCRNIR